MDHRCECSQPQPSEFRPGRCMACRGVIVTEGRVYGLTQDEALEALDKDLEEIFARDPAAWVDEQMRARRECAEQEAREIEEEHMRLVHSDGSDCPDGCGGE